MLSDLNEALARAAERRYDVCVCGTGPAGITTARKLAEHGKRILLLEGGGLSYSKRSQDLYNATNVGLQYWFLEEAGRARYFGGTSNHWAGRCGIFDDIDFDTRDDSGLPGWPISRQQVLRTREEAQQILDIPGANLAPVQDPHFATPLFARSGYALSPPTRFLEKYGAEIRQSQHIEAFYNANLVGVGLSDDQTRVQHVFVRNYNGKMTKVVASQFVLALGGIENARILLNASSQVPGGIGNHSGMVGRCFMEHLNVSIGRFLVTDLQFWRRGSFPLAPTDTMIRQHGIGNGFLVFEPNPLPQSSGRFKALREFLRDTSCAVPPIAGVARRIVDFDCPGDGTIGSLIEQAPNPNSRVSLTDEVDAFGLRRAQLNWQLSDRDWKTIRILSIESAKEMARLNRARVQLAPFILDRDRFVEVSGHAHHMGTTRMSADPRYGVVDENCRVHGVHNLYIGGSSVFPTGGGTNPTLTIVMLALRLADFLANQK